MIYSSIGLYVHSPKLITPKQLMGTDKLFILVNNKSYKQYFDATGKAPEDIEHILLESGCQRIETACCDPTDADKPKCKLMGYYYELKNAWLQFWRIVIHMPNDSVLVYQYPSVFWGDYPELYYCFLMVRVFCLLFQKRIEILFVIHDLPSIRFKDEHLKNWERKIFPLATYVISHNQQMTKYIKDVLYYKGAIANLDIFDYLVKKPKEYERHELKDSRTVAYAGNLIKPGFIYKIGDMGSVKIHLYGKQLRCEKEELPPCCEYKGCFAPDELPMIMNEDFALIWDGDTAEGISGLMGEYMRYNNPHKLSLYVVAHIPVIVWRNSAIADFVINNNIGFTVNNLSEMKERIINITQDEYNEMYDNISRLAMLLEHGGSIKRSISKLKGWC